MKKTKTKLFRNKKGGVFTFFLVMSMVIILVYAYITLVSKVESPTKYIGQGPLEIITEIQEGEKALIFLDFAAKMAVYQAVYDVSSGNYKNSSCGEYYDFVVWNDGNGNYCYPTKDVLEKALKDAFTSNLVARVAAYPNANFAGKSSQSAFSRGDIAGMQSQLGVTQSVSQLISTQTLSEELQDK